MDLNIEKQIDTFLFTINLSMIAFTLDLFFETLLYDFLFLFFYFLFIFFLGFHILASGLAKGRYKWI